MVGHDVGQGATPFTNRLAVLAGLASIRPTLPLRTSTHGFRCFGTQLAVIFTPVPASRLWRGSYGKEYRGRMYTRGPDFDGLACLQPKASCVWALDRARALHQG